MAQRGEGNSNNQLHWLGQLSFPLPTKGAERRTGGHGYLHLVFSAACVVNGYGDADRTRFMGALVEGTAQQIFNNVHTANQNANYQQLCDLLTAQFEPQQQQQLHEVELRARTKKPQETQTMLPQHCNY